MSICPQRVPPLEQVGGGQLAACLLHENSLTAAEREPLQREEISLADEA
jgi:hypothetical protein